MIRFMDEPHNVVETTNWDDLAGYRRAAGSGLSAPFLFSPWGILPFQALDARSGNDDGFGQKTVPNAERRS